MAQLTLALVTVIIGLPCLIIVDLYLAGISLWVAIPLGVISCGLCLAVSFSMFDSIFTGKNRWSSEIFTYLFVGGAPILLTILIYLLGAGWPLTVTVGLLLAVASFFVYFKR